MKDKDYRIIEDYLEGQLDPVGARQVEDRAAAEPAFAASLAEHRRLYDHLRAGAAADELRSLLGPLGERYFRATTNATNGAEPTSKQTATVRRLPHRKPTGRFWLGLVAAAGVALLLYLVSGALGPAPGSEYERFAQHQALELRERGESDNGITAIEAAYNEGRYEEARRLLEPYVAANPTDQRAQLALGVSLLEAGEDAGAVEVFEALAGGEGAVAPYANWYLALAALRQDDPGAARRYLDRIPAGDAYLRQRVTDLREVLRYR